MLNRVRSRLTRRGADRGALAPAVAILLLPLFALSGLIVDGSRYLDARSTAQAFAEEAARAGAMQVDLTQPGLVLLPDAQISHAIEDYCARIEADSRASSTSNVVVVSCGAAPQLITDSAAGNPIVVHARVSVRITTWMLDLVGADSFTATVEASAEPQQGVVAPEDH